MNAPSRENGSGSGAWHVTEILCVDLLCGHLTGQERRRVLDHLKACPSCEVRFQEICVDRERARARGVVQRAADGQLVLTERSVIDETQPAAGSNLGRLLDRVIASFRMRRYRWAGALATAAVGVLLVFLAIRPDAPDRLDPQRLPGRMDDVQFRSAVEHSRNRLFGAGLEAYADGDLDRAIERLQAAKVEGVAEIIRTVYLANALAEKKRYEEASRLLKEIPLQRLPDPWGSEASWTLYVSLRKTGHSAEADSLLRLLVRYPGEVGARAREIE